MKKIKLIAIALLFCPIVSFSCDSLKIRGYLIYEYSKQDVISNLKNHKISNLKSRRSTPVDVHSYHYFIPADSIIISLKESIQKYSGFSRKIVYSIPATSEARKLLSDRCAYNTVSQKINRPDSDYYAIPGGDSTKLYVISYIDTDGFIFDFESTIRNRIKAGVSDDEVVNNGMFGIIVPYKVNVIVNDFSCLEDLINFR